MRVCVCHWGVKGREQPPSLSLPLHNNKKNVSAQLTLITEKQLQKNLVCEREGAGRRRERRGNNMWQKESEGEGGYLNTYDFFLFPNALLFCAITCARMDKKNLCCLRKENNFLQLHKHFHALPHYCSAVTPRSPSLFWENHVMRDSVRMYVCVCVCVCGGQGEVREGGVMSVCVCVCVLTSKWWMEGEVMFAEQLCRWCGRVTNQK
jgi:hypothetical protein